VSNQKNTVLTLDDIHCRFGDSEILKGISLDIQQGEFIVLLGASGCGKSTLLNCIAGLEPVNQGRIVINNEDVTQHDPSSRNVAMVFQSYALYPTMTVSRNITFSLECQRVPRAERQRQLQRVAQLLEIDNLLERKPAQLSGGQRQRVAIGRALVRNPDLYLLDEPMSNLDARLRQQTRLELRALHKKLGGTFILVTHDQLEALSIATRIAVMHQGVIQQFATPYDIYHRPLNRFVADFVGSPKMNFIEGEFVQINESPHINLHSQQISLADYKFKTTPAPGQKLFIGIRPENIYRSRDRLEGRHPTEISLIVSDTELTRCERDFDLREHHKQVAARPCCLIWLTVRYSAKQEAGYKGWQITPNPNGT